MTLGANVVYINSADTMPQINGSETYTLQNSSAYVEGATVAMDYVRRRRLPTRDLRRDRHARAAGPHWPRIRQPRHRRTQPAATRAPFISEFSDALGTGNFMYEFIELFNDK